MNRLKSMDRSSLRGFVAKLDRLAGDLNVLLVVVAVGLAALDATFFFTQKVVDHLPPVTRVVYVDAGSPSK
jgi:hypothetical protein